MTDARGHAKTISPRAYDWLSRAAGVGDAHWQLVAQAAIGAGATVLEVGVGTGNILLKVKRAVPASIAIGLDTSAASLVTAARKAARARVEIQLDHGDATHLPYPDAGIDRILSSFVFHHIPDDQKLATLSEVRRVLKPDGSLHLLDFVARPERKSKVLATLRDRHDHDRPRVVDPVELMAQAGLTDPVHISDGASRLGRHAFYRASR
ncbi:class I SAM-dependent methyltransferase [Nocardia vaccinii]|uniref:class I SAM-dependent methyltransferase n=1 Tax=Nocardia vaccinii TaxID=1822 RepID=UPI00082E50B9|nr:methyltransferase domain-containing protein [Nocardia vaccinii]